MNTKTISVLSAAFMMAMVSGASAGNTVLQPRIFVCDGRPFSGDYLVKQFPTISPVTPHDLNVYDDFVQSVGPASNWLLVTPKNPSMDCHAFMEEMDKTGIVDHIQPNWIFSIN